jgi:hypothetical protein
MPTIETNAQTGEQYYVFEQGEATPHSDEIIVLPGGRSAIRVPQGPKSNIANQQGVISPDRNLQPNFQYSGQAASSPNAQPSAGMSFGESAMQALPGLLEGLGKQVMQKRSERLPQAEATYPVAAGPETGAVNPIQTVMPPSDGRSYSPQYDMNSMAAQGYQGVDTNNMVVRPNVYNQMSAYSPTAVGGSAFAGAGGVDQSQASGTGTDAAYYPRSGANGRLDYPMRQSIVGGDGGGQTTVVGTGGGDAGGDGPVIDPVVEAEKPEEEKANNAATIVKAVEQAEKQSGGGSDASDELKRQLSGALKDPYRWQNFFANAAIAFNTLRDPRLRDQQLPVIMAERIKSNRKRFQGMRTAEYFSKDYPEIADMIRTGGLEAKDALTYIAKVGDATKLTEAMRTRMQAAQALNLTPGTPEYNSVISGGSPSDPSKTKYERRKDLRNSFNSLQSTKDFQSVVSAFGRIEASASNPSAAGDLALIFNYMKMLDPGSVVRESEFRTAQDAKAWLYNIQQRERDGESFNIPNFVRTWIEKASKGTMLIPSQREDFVNRAAALYTKAESGYQSAVDTYIDIAKGEEFYDPDIPLIPDIRYRAKERFGKEGSDEKIYAPPKVGEVVAGEEGKKYRFKGGDPSLEESWELVE